MSRYTEAQLIELIVQVNRLTESPESMFYSQQGIDCCPQTGHYYLKRGRDGYILARIVCHSGEWRDVFGQGWMTKPELGARIASFILGLEQASSLTVA